MSELKNRIDFVYIFDVQDGNPNGDPDAGNLPRVDAETGMGLVTDVCLKRKVRNYVQVAKDLADGYDIFIKERAVLNNSIDAAHEEESVKSAKDKTMAARDIMCKKYYDVQRCCSRKPSLGISLVAPLYCLHCSCGNNHNTLYYSDEKHSEISSHRKHQNKKVRSLKWIF